MFELLAACVSCLVAGYWFGRRVSCQRGSHRGPINVTYSLITRQRPWCWEILITCECCKGHIWQHNLDERDAEYFLLNGRARPRL